MPKKDDYIYGIKNFRSSVFYLKIIIIVSILIIIARLAYLQIIQYKYFNSVSKRNSVKLIKIFPPRGIIKTSDGIIYAKNIPVFSLYYTRNRKINYQELKLLSYILHIKIKQIKKNILSHAVYSTFLLESDINKKQVFIILSDRTKLPNVSVEVAPKRIYPNDAEAYAHITGYISKITKEDLQNVPFYAPGELIGRGGIEKKYNSALMGKMGVKETEVNADGSRVKLLSETPPKKGDNVVLTINAELQTFLYELLKDYEGSIIVMKTDGSILGMVSRPSFNPNDFVNGMSRKKWRDLKSKKGLFDISTQGVYPPGSLIKPFIALSALKEKIITPNSVLNCPYNIKIGKNIYRDWKYGGFGKINLERAIESSSDVFFYQVGMKLGIKSIDTNLMQFGFGIKPNLFDSDKGGNLPSALWKYKHLKQDWYLGDTIITSIGQGFFTVSPLQVAVAFSIIANNGIGYRPHLLNGVEKISYFFKSKYYNDIKNALWLVVNGKYGTASSAKVDGMNICGKTGTSQVVSSSMYKKFREKNRQGKLSKKQLLRYTPHAWFASFAPKINPKVVVVVFLKHGRTSGNAAKKAKSIYIKLRALKLF